jgi:hypothetical protein
MHELGKFKRTSRVSSIPKWNPLDLARRNPN